ncbi:MAG: hypothetical protein Q8P93_04465 [bacterium]|nr:hypothetical protein [bacterium]
MHMTRDIKKYEEALLKEKQELEGQLGHLGRANPATPGGFETTYADSGAEVSDPNLQKPDQGERANDIEEYETRNAIEVQLETRYHEVLEALGRIENHTYGWCTQKGESHPIEDGRLEINPAAITCVAHKDVR